MMDRKGDAKTVATTTKTLNTAQSGEGPQISMNGYKYGTKAKKRIHNTELHDGKGTRWKPLLYLYKLP